jgi:hypothetical protein
VIVKIGTTPVKTQQINSSIGQLQETIKRLSINDRWFLLKWLFELLQPQTNLRQPETSNPDRSFYGCIQDDTFLRHSQGNQVEREPIS